MPGQIRFMKKLLVVFYMCCAVLPALRAQKAGQQQAEQWSLQATTLFNQADDALRAGNHVNALLLYQESAALYVEIFGTGHPRLVHIYRTIAQRLADNHQLSEGLAYLQKAIAILEVQPEENHFKLGKLYLTAGHIKRALNNSSGAASSYQKSLEIFKNLPKLPDAETVTLLYLLLAQVNFELGKYQKAIQFYRQTADIIVKNTGTELNHNLAVIYGNIGRAYFESDSTELAVGHLQKAVELNYQLFGKPTEDIAHIYAAIFSIHFSNQQLDSAVTYAKKTLRVYEALHNRHLNDHVEFLSLLSRRFFEGQAYATSAIWYRQYLDLLKSSGQMDAEQLLHYHIQVAQLFAEQWQYHEAMQFYQQTLALSAELFGAFNFRTGNIALEMASRYERLQNYDAARQMYERASEVFEVTEPYNQQLQLKAVEKTAEMYALQKQYLLASFYFKRVAAALPEMNNRKASIYHQIASGNYFLQQLDSALRYALAETTFYEKTYQGEHINMATACLLTGNIMAAMEQFEEASRYFDKALAQDPEIFLYEMPLSVEACRYLAYIYEQKGDVQKSRYYKQRYQRYESYPASSFLRGEGS